MEATYCQSCGMPLNQEILGTEADGSKSGLYCTYCYQGGGFTGEMTMDEMIEFCVPHLLRENLCKTEEQARGMMRQFLPNLKRWAK